MGTDASAYWTENTWGEHFCQVLPFLVKALEKPERYCVSIYCDDTNWGGIDRCHSRSDSCPEFTEQAQNDLANRILHISDYLETYPVEKSKAVAKETANINYLANKIMGALNGR